MRAKVIVTGEIVDVEFLMKTSDRTFVYREIPTLPTSRMFQQTDLMFFDVNPTKEIDWEQRRFELVKAVLPTAMSIRWNEQHISVDSIVKTAIAYADAVIAKLKEE